MTYARAIRFVTLFLLAFWLVPAVAAVPKPADQVFRLSVTLGEDEELDLNWSIEPGYYLYRDKLAATLGGKRLKLTTAQGELKDDPNFGPTEVYHREASAYIEAVPAKGEVLVTFQGCGENTICYPPVDQGDRSCHACGERCDRKSGAPAEPVFRRDWRAIRHFDAAGAAPDNGAECIRPGWRPISPLF